MAGSVNGKDVGEVNGAAGIIVVAVGTATCASALDVPTLDMAGSTSSVGPVVGTDMKLLQDANNAETRINAIGVLPKIFTLFLPLMFFKETLNSEPIRGACALWLPTPKRTKACLLYFATSCLVEFPDAVIAYI